MEVEVWRSGIEDRLERLEAITMRDLAVKFTSYTHYLASRAWAREHSILPAFICVAPEYTPPSSWLSLVETAEH